MDSAPAAATAVVTGIGGGYPDSMDSSPRSRGGESWDEPSRPPSVSAAPAPPPQKLRLMCSYGGHIMPRPHDKTLCYLGGDTRIVVVDRHATLAELSSKISRSLLGGRPFALKYQLPSEDLDSLISVTTEEDLENMVDEYDRIVGGGGASRGSGGGGGGAGGKSSRLRLFLFPAKAESSPSSSVGSLLDDTKSDTWFVDALNGGPIGTGGVLPRRLSDDSMASSINCLLGLEEDRHQKTPPSAAIHPLDQIGAGDHRHSTDHHQPQLVQPDSPGKHAVAGKNNGQEIQSMPDSPMLDTSSSFGSTSSAPSLSNLPPIRVRPEDPCHEQHPAAGGLEEHFAHLGVSAQKQDEGFKDGAFVVVDEQPPPPHPSFITAAASPPSATNSATTAFSPTEHPHGGFNRVVSSDDEKSDHSGGVWKPTQHHVSPVQQPRASDPDHHQNAERPSLHTDRASPGAGGSNLVPEMFFEAQNSLFVSNIGAHAQSHDQGYLIAVQQQQPQQHQYPVQQQQQQQHQYQHQPQQQPQSQPSLPPLPHYLHPSPHLVPYPSYYLQPQQHLTPSSHYNPQVPLYFVPVHNPNYAPIPQSNLVDTAATAPPSKLAVPAPNSMAAAPPANPPQPTPELAAGAAIYRTSGAGATAMAPPPPTPQLIQQPYMGYHAAHHHASQQVMAPGYGYDFTNAVHSQPMYYASHPTSAPVTPPQYQAVSSAAAATMISDHQAHMLHLADANQKHAS